MERGEEERRGRVEIGVERGVERNDRTRQNRKSKEG